MAYFNPIISLIIFNVNTLNIKLKRQKLSELTLKKPTWIQVYAVYERLTLNKKAYLG